jgi:probable HAF family extracellular repeat protein
MGNITYATGISINNNGDIVGKAQFAGSNFTHAALWRNGVATDLGVLTNLSGSERISIQP